MVESHENHEKLRVASTKQTQHATLTETGATARATNAQPGSLKVLSSLVLSRNKERNRNATDTENGRNFDTEKTPEKLRQDAGEIAEEVGRVNGIDPATVANAIQQIGLFSNAELDAFVKDAKEELVGGSAIGFYD